MSAFASVAPTETIESYQSKQVVDAILDRARALKQALIQFVLSAEGELAIALESFVAQKSNAKSFDINQRNLVIDTFLAEGQVEGKTPIDWFLASQPNLSKGDRELVEGWKHSFIGLFEVVRVFPDGFELMNWLTAKHYVVKPNDPLSLEEMARFKPGEILLTRIAPVSDYWMFSGPCMDKGRLSKPKLAVTIGEFKQNHKNALYSDAPELLEEAWKSVAQYHEEFIEHFGSDRVTLSGYQLNKQITELQEKMTQKRLAAAGIDSSKSLKELIEETGADEEEVRAAAVEAGANAKEVDQIFGGDGATKMAIPKTNLPDEIRKAEQVTAFSHPRWGQMFLPTYSKFESMLEAENWHTVSYAGALVQKYLDDPKYNVFIWQQLADQYPAQLETLLQMMLNRPDFKLKTDLEPTLTQEFKKPLEPELPEIASVPIHLHELFQTAVAEVNKTKGKPKAKKKTAKGFQ